MTPSSTILIDIGINLTNGRYNDNWKSVIKEAKDANVEQLVITGTSPEESFRAHEMFKQFPSILASTAGCHPHDADKLNIKDIEQIKFLLHQPGVVAVGECGLDFNRNYSSKESQIAAFERQLELAIETQKPLFLHERDAFETQYAMLKSCWDQLNGAVTHCFTGNRQQLEDYLELGLSIGITGWICDKRRGAELFEIVSAIPDDRLMVETDAPFLLPQNITPKPKSRTNYPAYLPWVVKKVAEARGQTFEHVASITTSNARNFFSL